MTEDSVSQEKWRITDEFLRSPPNSADDHVVPFTCPNTAHPNGAPLSISELLDNDCLIRTSLNKLSKQAAAAQHIGPVQTQFLLSQYLWVCSCDVGGEDMLTCCGNEGCPCVHASQCGSESLASMLESAQLSSSSSTSSSGQRCRMMTSLQLYDIVSRCYDAESGGFLPSPCGSGHQLADLLPTVPMTHVALHILNTLRLTSLAVDGTLTVGSNTERTDDSSSTSGQLSLRTTNVISKHSLTLTHAKWLNPRHTVSFVLKCQKKSQRTTKSSSSVTTYNEHRRIGSEPVPCGSTSADEYDELMAGGFAASPSVKEIDLRHTFSALMALSLLVSPLALSEVVASARRSNSAGVRTPDPTIGGRGKSIVNLLDAEEIESVAGAVRDAASFITRCWNAREGGFGGILGEEAHGGMTYCAIASLALTGHLQKPKQYPFIEVIVPHVLQWCLRRLSATPDSIVDDILNRDTAQSYLSGDSTLDVRGFQGRMHKDSDSCYTYWVGCTLDILSNLDWLRPRAWMRNSLSTWLDTQPLFRFLCTCKDSHVFAKNPHSCADSAHTCFGLCGASLLLSTQTSAQTTPAFATSFRRIHPVYGCSLLTASETKLPTLFFVV